MAQTTTVVIVGAGPTGLTLACQLARRGVSFRLVEAAPGPQPGSRGKGIQPRTLEVFDDLGLVDRVLAHGRLGMPVRTTAADGRVTMSNAERPAARPDIPYPAGLIIPEWRVEEALRAGLAGLGGTVAFGTRFVGFEATADGVAVTAEIDGTTHTIAARWLVGCDGGHSAVRKAAGIAFVGETRDAVRMIVADVAVDGLDREAWHVWQHPDGFLGLCPLPSTAMFQFQAGIAPGQDAGLGVANLQALLDRRSGRTDILLGAPEWSSLWRANVRLVDRYRVGPVFVAGDAAHIHSPAGGQGMNTGIQDACNLGWKFAAVAGGAPSALLDSYEAERRPVAADVLALSDSRLRQALAGNALPTQRDARVTQLAINYRGSALASDQRDEAASLRAGDRAPDATALRTIGGERRLFDLLRGGRFTLIGFGPGADSVALPSEVRRFSVVAHPTRPGEVADTRGHLAAAYGAREGTLVLIRPDGYVGAIADDGDAALITRYFARVSGPQPLNR